MEKEVIQKMNTETKILDEFTKNLIPFAVEYFIGFNHLQYQNKLKEYFLI